MTKTLYLNANEPGWNTAVSVKLDSATTATETKAVRWKLKHKCPSGELWISTRGERAFSLDAILDDNKLSTLLRESK